MGIGDTEHGPKHIIEPNKAGTPIDAEGKKDEEIGVDMIRASDIVRNYFISTYSPWIFLFQIESIRKNSKENVYIVQCSFFRQQGGYEKNYYTVKVNIKTGKFEGELAGFSLDLKTGVKKLLEVEPPNEI